MYVNTSLWELVHMYTSQALSSTQFPSPPRTHTGDHDCTAKTKLLTVMHVFILVAVSQGLVTLSCSDMWDNWLALCALVLYAPLGEVSYQQSQPQALRH